MYGPPGAMPTLAQACFGHCEEHVHASVDMAPTFIDPFKNPRRVRCFASFIFIPSSKGFLIFPLLMHVRNQTPEIAALRSQ
jgi:hypothetical protein